MRKAAINYKIHDEIGTNRINQQLDEIELLVPDKSSTETALRKKVAFNQILR